MQYPIDILPEGALAEFQNGKLGAKRTIEIFEESLPAEEMMEITLASLQKTPWKQSKREVRKLVKYVKEAVKEDQEFEGDSFSDDFVNLPSQALGLCLHQWSRKPLNFKNPFSGEAVTLDYLDPLPSQKRRREHVRFLIEVGAHPMAVVDVGTRFSGKRTVLGLACILADPVIVKDLLWWRGRATADRISQLFSFDFPLKHFDKLEIEWDWLRRPIKDVRRGWTLLHDMCVGQDALSRYIINGEVTPTLARKLRSHGIDFNKPNNIGVLPLEYAIEHPSEFSALLKNGADISLLDVEKFLSEAEELELDPQIVRILRRHVNA